MSSALDKVEENIFKLTSNELVNNNTLPNAQVYNGYGCHGGNVSPQLEWHNIPQNTKSFAIICHDPDAPRPNGWYHWLVVNIEKNITSIKQGEKIKNSLETMTDFDKAGYGGACPPVGHGVHRYNFTVYALDVEHLDVSVNSKPKEVESEILRHVIAKSTITGLYERK
ncbi:YbhB/YbcL family Raf kinase inhibitor-like protein [bacterium]|nr:YbhB/YbcL family Raf kinase inhibitor-like protein [bacterium]